MQQRPTTAAERSTASGSLARLVDELCARFEIPRRYPDPPFDYYGDALADFDRVIGHAMVRTEFSGASERRQRHFAAPMPDFAGPNGNARLPKRT